jgi:hypothetical protein
MLEWSRPAPCPTTPSANRYVHPFLLVYNLTQRQVSFELDFINIFVRVRLTFNHIFLDSRCGNRWS